MKKLLVTILTLLLCLGTIAGCGTAPASGSAPSEAAPVVPPAASSAPSEAVPAAPAAPSASSPAVSAADASAPAPVGDAAKKAILVVSFGTSYNVTREATIGAVEKAIAAAYPDFDVRRAFTSQMIIKKLKTRDQLEIDNVQQAIERLIADGVGTLVVQPTHVMNGFEYDEMRATIAPFEANFAKISYGQPLLSSDTDYEEMVALLAAATKSSDVTGNEIIFMGHGTEHAANATYQKLDDCFKKAGYANYAIGTVEATPTLEDVIAETGKSGAKKVVLFPLMIVAGDHANKDMAGDDEGSWKTKFKAEGYEVECVLKGLGEYPAIQEMFVRHAGDAIAHLAK